MPRNDLPVLDFDRERRRLFISSSGTEEPGSQGCAANRASTNSSSAGDEGGLSNAKARRNQYLPLLKGKTWKLLDAFVETANFLPRYCC
jgi:hypothetical protein